MSTTDPSLDLEILNPELPRVGLAVAPFGHPAQLVLVLPTHASGLLAALLRWGDGSIRELRIGKA